MEGFWRVNSTLGKVAWLPSTRKGSPAIRTVKV
jgi:hypothetical protein